MSKRFDNALMGLKDTYPMPDPRRREEFLNSLPVQEKRRTAVIPFLNGKPVWYAIPAVAVAAVMLMVGIRTYRQNPPHQIPVVETTATSYTETVTQETLTETVTQVMTETTQQTTNPTTKAAPTTETETDVVEVVPGAVQTKATSAVTTADTTVKPTTRLAQSPVQTATAAPTRATDPQQSMTHKPASLTTKAATKPTTHTTTNTTRPDLHPDTTVDDAPDSTEPTEIIKPSNPNTETTTRRTTTTTRQTTAATRRTTQTTATTRRTTQTTATTRRTTQTTATTRRTTDPTTARPADPTEARTTTWTTTRITAQTTQTYSTTAATTYWYEFTTTPPETIPIYSTEPTVASTEAAVPAETTVYPSQEGTMKQTETTTDRATEATYTQATESTTQPETYRTVAVDPEYSKVEQAPVWTDFSFDYEPDSDQVPIWGSQAETASDIVCGRIVNIRYTRIGVIPYTAIDVEVTNVITGRPKGGTLTVFEPGGYIPLEELAEYDYDISERAASMTADERAQAETIYEKATSLPEPVIGEECMFFLRKDWSGNAFFYSGSPHFCRLKPVAGDNPATADQKQFMLYSGRFRLTPFRLRNYLETGE